MNGQKPNAENKRRFELIREAGCIVCKLENGLYTSPQIHHIAGCKDQEAHKKTIGLCYYHHMADQQQPPHPDYVSRHPRKAAFQERHGTEEFLLEKTNECIEPRRMDR